MITYGIRWGNGRITVVGQDAAYARHLLGEASGPFSAFEPPPAVVKIEAPTMVPAHRITPGMAVECPRRSSIGNHLATVTHATRVGTGSFRIVVTLDCGHDVNLSDGHGLYVVEAARDGGPGCPGAVSAS